VIEDKPPPPPPPPQAVAEADVGNEFTVADPPLPPPPTTVTLIALTVAGFVHVLDDVYTFITTSPEAPLLACTEPSGKVTPGAPIVVVAIPTP
jgi:hypothetical protein